MTLGQFHFTQLDYALDIFADHQQVGRLGFEPEGDTYSLQYSAAWGSRGNALSPHLPMGRAASTHTIRRFLENLLPEGRALEVASIHTNIQKNNVFGLIRYLGKETTGGLTFLPAGQTPKELTPIAREVTLQELQERIDQRNKIHFTVWDGKVRISVAGFQDKLLVHQHRGRMFLADGSLSSTHILKPEPTNTALPFMVANEHYCMQLAARISQQRYQQNHVAQVDILRAPSPVLCIKRFDRKPRRLAQDVVILDQNGEPKGQTISMDIMERLQIIDGCQACDLSVAGKYERNFGNARDVAHIRDGASFQKIFAGRAHWETPAVGVQRLVLWAVTTLLFGNSDAHGKNISFHVGRAGLNVAELYDLVSVVQYDATKLEHSLAMAFGDEFELDAVKSFTLADFCHRCGISRSFFARELETLCAIALEQATVQAQEEVYVADERDIVGHISDLVTRRATLLKAMSKEITTYKNDMF